MFMMLRMPMDDIKELHAACSQQIQKGKITNSVELWDAVVEGLGRWQRSAKTGKGRVKLADGNEIERDATQLHRLVEANKAEIVFAHVFPRVDVEVTKGVNHLLKAPFCVHPKTGKLCVPMDTDTIDDFDPNNQPTLRTLHDELIKTGNPKDTSMGKAIEIFERTFLDGLRQSVNGLGHAMEED